MDTQRQIESIESDIKEAQKKLAESEQKLNALKAEQKEPRNYDGPSHGYLWNRWAHAVERHVGTGKGEGSLYLTGEEAEWQGNSERVRRKLQRIAKALNPPGWEPNDTAYEFLAYSIHGTTGSTGIYFTHSELCDEARRILGDDVKYLNWYESPEFKK